MAFYHGKKTRANKKRKRLMGREAAHTTIGEKKVRKVKTKGGSAKNKLSATKEANVVIGGKSVKCEISSVDETPSNKDFVRRSIITKGAVLTVKDPEGKELKATVTSRPGQDGVVNAKAV